MTNISILMIFNNLIIYCIKIFKIIKKFTKFKIRIKLGQHRINIFAVMKNILLNLDKFYKYFI